MQSLLWYLAQRASRILADQSEREALLGDLEERNLAGTFRGLADITYFVASRQLKMWQTWRPWLTLLALFFPLSVLLQSALSIAYTLANHPWPDNAFYDSPDLKTALVVGTACTILWAWSAGFALVKFGRHATWSLVPILALATWLPFQLNRTPSFSMLCLTLWFLMVVLPAWSGARACFRSAQLGGIAKGILAAVLTMNLYFMIVEYANKRPNLHAFDLAMAAFVLWPIAVPFTSRAR